MTTSNQDDNNKELDNKCTKHRTINDETCMFMLKSLLITLNENDFWVISLSLRFSLIEPSLSLVPILSS